MTTHRVLQLLLAALVLLVALALALAVGMPYGPFIALAILQVAVTVLLVRIWLSLERAVTFTRRCHEHELRRLRTELADNDTDRSPAEVVEALEWAEVHRHTSKRDQVTKYLERIERRVGEESDNVYRQLEALDALYRDIRPDRALPPLRRWAASPDLLHYLYRHIEKHHPTKIVECGSGVSTLVMASALHDSGLDGRVIALEHLDNFAVSTHDLLRDHGVAAFGEVRHAPLCEIEINGTSWIWYDLAVLPTDSYFTADLIFIDGPPHQTGKHARYPAVHLLRPIISEETTIILDDFDRQDEREVIEMWQEEFPGIVVEQLRLDKGAALLRQQMT